MKKPFQLKTHVGLSRNPHTLAAVSVQMKSHSGFLRAVVWLEKVEEKQADKEWCFWVIGLCACLVKSSSLIRLMTIGRVEAPFVALGGNLSFSPVIFIFMFPF